MPLFGIRLLRSSERECEGHHGHHQNFFMSLNLFLIIEKTNVVYRYIFEDGAKLRKNFDFTPIC